MSKKNSLDSITSVEDLKKQKVSFETALNKLEDIVSTQSNTDISLEESIKNFKLSKILSEYCQDILNQAKSEIEEIE